ncbi:MAG: hypothetical protein K2N99_01880 [Malacoplasma sp.]|nr:hypothetical protein [Malacoplasma sp.]
MIEDTINETSGSEDQIQSENSDVIAEYLDRISEQTSTINPDLMPIDYVEEFVTNFLEADINSVYDNSIYVNSVSDAFNDYLHNFEYLLASLINSGFGVTLSDGDIRLYYYLYQIFVTKFADYFVYYVNGLQKLDSTFEEDIPNWNELSFDFFRKKTGDESPVSLSTISEYVDYVIETLIPESYFEICLEESTGDVALTEVFIETANYRVQYDSEFFRIKLAKILSSDIIRDNIVNRLSYIFIDGHIA